MARDSRARESFNMNRREFLGRTAGAMLAAGGIDNLVMARQGPIGRTDGPLRICRRNPRYFEDSQGQIVYLTGSHTWSNVVDIGPRLSLEPFDFERYLRFLLSYGHNFTRLWTWEASTMVTTDDTIVRRVAPLWWRRTGPGLALDGRPRFNLDLFDDSYFERLSRRVATAGANGIYVSVMLFEGWGLQYSPGAWESHPFHPANNVNGIGADENLDGSGIEAHTLGLPSVTRLQENYVKKVIDSVNSFDNVLYEICNEAQPSSTEWQYHMVEFVRDYEASKPDQHPVGMTFQHPDGSNETLLQSPADWVSPDAGVTDSLVERLLNQLEPRKDYRFNPPPADGRKVILSDTDHLWGLGGNQAWVWMSFLRGLNPIFMDPYDGVVFGRRFNPRWEPIRRSMGYTRRYAERIDLARMTPEGGLASSGYCLSDPGHDYLVYVATGGQVSVNLSDAVGWLQIEWFDPNTDSYVTSPPVEGRSRREFRSPFGADSVLRLSADD